MKAIHAEFGACAFRVGESGDFWNVKLELTLSRGI